MLFQSFVAVEPAIAIFTVFLGHVGSETIWSAQGSERLKRVYSLPEIGFLLAESLLLAHDLSMSRVDSGFWSFFSAADVKI